MFGSFSYSYPYDLTPMAGHMLTCFSINRFTLRMPLAHSSGAVFAKDSSERIKVVRLGVATFSSCSMSCFINSASAFGV